MSKDHRKQYWENNYLKYWQERTDQQKEDQVSVKDIKPPDQIVFEKFYQIALKSLNVKNGPILDIGVGFGRFIQVFRKRFKDDIWGTDISESMTTSAKESFPELKKKLFTADAEEQPFKDQKFAFINCWAVFDATYQDKVLFEIQRLLQVGGVAIITGKNTNYYQTDKKAYVAEVNARKKGHPNFFTKVDFLVQHIDDFGLEVVGLYKFKRRGDWSKEMFGPADAKKFYEYILIVRKVKHLTQSKSGYKISEKYSQVFQQKNV